MVNWQFFESRIRGRSGWMKSSRYYQNCLQIMMSVSSLLLFFSGFFLSKENLRISLLFLLVNLVAGYLGADFKYKRYKAIVEEVESNILLKKLMPSAFYQRWLQIFGRGKDVVVFFLGLLLGKGYWLLAVLLLVFQLFDKIIMSELVYKREQAVLYDKNQLKN